MKTRDEPDLSTAELLLAQYGPRVLVPIEDVCRDYFSHLTLDNFLRKVGNGEIFIPVVRVERSQKCHKGIHMQDLADYIDKRREAALKELRQLHNLHR